MSNKNEDLNYNLELVNLAIADRIQEIPRFFLVEWFIKFAHLINLQLWGIIAISVYIILVALVILNVLLFNFRRTKFARYSIVFFILLFTVCTSSPGSLSSRLYAPSFADQVDDAEYQLQGKQSYADHKQEAEGPDGPGKCAQPDLSDEKPFPGKPPAGPGQQPEYRR